MTESIPNHDIGLQDLVESFPDVWKDVMGTIRGYAETNRLDQIGVLAQSAAKSLSRWNTAAGTPIGETPHAKNEIIRARMTILAAKQFTAAFDAPSAKISWRDRWVIQARIIRKLERGHIFERGEFDRHWLKLKDKYTACRSVQSAGFWFVPTQEFCSRIADLAAGRPILELGSGRGLLVAGLAQRGLVVTGVDDESWAGARTKIKKTAALISCKSAQDALKDSKPEVVISAWPPPGNLFEAAIFKTKSVNLYLAVVSRHRFASGNWDSYKRQNDFDCVSIEAANQDLRPIEAEQQLLIFRRKGKY